MGSAGVPSAGPGESQLRDWSLRLAELSAIPDLFAARTVHFPTCSEETLPIVAITRPPPPDI